MPEEHFMRKESYDRGADPELQWLIHTPGKPKEYGDYIPILFPIEDQTIIMSHIFRSTYLAKVHTLALHRFSVY